MYLDPFVNAAKALGGDAATVGDLIQNAWQAQRDFLLMASQCRKPDPATIAAKLGHVQAITKQISDSVRRNEWENHMKTVKEGVQALGWLAIEPAPRDFIESYIGGSDYWANNIRREHRKSNPQQMAFVDTFKTLLSELLPYVKEFHTTGVAWNPRGMPISEYSAGASSAATTTAAPAQAKSAAASAPAPAPAARSAADEKPASGNLFSELNKGGAITSGLKKVTKDMQTWRSEYKASAKTEAPEVKPRSTPAPAAAAKATSSAPGPRGPARCEFQNAGKKWVVENQTGASTVVEVQVTDAKHSVYISSCMDATVNITGKCKSVMIDGCKKTKVLFDDCVSACEVVNCQRMQIQSRGKLPSVAIDKTDGILVYLSRESLDAPIVASKSSEMNVSFPNNAGEMLEMPIPEQFVSRITTAGDNYRIHSEVSELYS
jgi:adenylyl cyclase-associated protein